MGQMDGNLFLTGEGWEKIFNSISDIITIQGIDRKIYHANHATCEHLQLTAEQILGRFCYEVFRGTQIPCEDCPVHYGPGEFKTFANAIEHKNLNKIFLVSVSPLRDDAGRIYAIIHFAKDITDCQKMQSQLQQARKMEAVGRLAGGIAHDFNNMLTPIIGFSDLAMRKIEIGHHLYSYFATIQQTAQRAADLTRQLLAFSRKQQIWIKPVRLDSIVNDMVKMLERVINGQVRMRIMNTAGNCTIMADKNQVEQVVMNLVINARDAMPQGGTVFISTSAVLFDMEDGVRYPGLPAGNYVLLAVRDTGCGMTSEVQEKIFEPFFTTKEMGKGTGLGLATIYGIVKQHNGYIYVNSEPEMGATFSVFFPSSEAVAWEQTDETAAVQVRGGCETILVVDDEPSILTLVAEILHPLGYQVLTASSGEKAIGVSDNWKGGIDLLLSDVAMPGMDGKRLCGILQGKRGEMRVLFMSGYVDFSCAEKNKTRVPVLSCRNHLMS